MLRKNIRILRAGNKNLWFLRTDRSDIAKETPRANKSTEIKYGRKLQGTTFQDSYPKLWGFGVSSCRRGVFFGGNPWMHCVQTVRPAMVKLHTLVLVFCFNDFLVVEYIT